VKPKANANAKKAERASAATARPAAVPVPAANTEGGATSAGAASTGAVSGGVAGLPGGGTAADADVGGGGGEGKIFEISDLRVSRRVKPDYPVIARKRKEEGTVTLLITIEGASVSSVKVEKTSGFPMLDEAAAAAVRKWRFEPGGAGAWPDRAQPYKVQARVPVTFKLKL
jgi:protein TonB